jgi:hypothetical protein
MLGILEGWDFGVSVHRGAVNCPTHITPRGTGEVEGALRLEICRQAKAAKEVTGE